MFRALAVADTEEAVAAVDGHALEADAVALRAGQVEIRRTTDGMPHVRALDWQSLGAGVGYVQAQDALCTLAEAFVTYEGRRAWFFGAEARPQHDSTLGRPTNIELDFFFKAFADDRAVARVWAAQPPELRALVAGYVKGYNRYLREQSGRGAGKPIQKGRKRHDCLEKPWLRKIKPADLYRRFHAAQIAAGYAHFIPELVGAQGPISETISGKAMGQRSSRQSSWLLPVQPNGLFPFRRLSSVGHREAVGSNMIALGDEATGGTGGVLLGNPHWYWAGPDRFYQMHLTIPGKLDVAGVGFLGVPVVMLGFNQQVAWSHTVSAARRFGLFELKLDPGDPTRYQVDGRWHAMESRTVRVAVRDAKGGQRHVSRVFYATRFGPLVELSGMFPDVSGWGRHRALALRDVNAENFRVFPGFLRWNRAASLDEFIAIQREELGIPWVNTAAIGRGEGRVWYADVGTVPNVSDAWRRVCASALSAALSKVDPLMPVLDGTRSACQWPNSPKARQPGAMSPDQMPWLLRRDYVANMNDSYWLSNVHQPLEGFAQVLGGEREPLSWRSRQGHRMAMSILADKPGSAVLASEQLRHRALNDVVETARLFKDAWLTKACPVAVVNLQAAELKTLGLGAAEIEATRRAAARHETPVQQEKQWRQGNGGNQGRGNVPQTSGPWRVPIGEACSVLKRWDGRAAADARGALLWELAWAAMALLDESEPVYEVPFSLEDPLNTPRQRRFSAMAAARALAAAHVMMQARGLSLDAPLGEARYLKAGRQRLPLFGGCHQFGHFAVACEDDPLQPLGPNTLANTYMQVVHFDALGVVAHTLLAHGQDERVFEAGKGLEPVLRYARKDWLRFPFHEADIRRDPSMHRQVLRFDGH
ncbi:MAG: penicillin acylase family protein [Lautropia sp.]|nr:penicillin acylase family protein [Lautropia sp.]